MAHSPDIIHVWGVCKKNYKNKTKNKELDKKH